MPEKFATYVHPSSNAEVVEVVCPKHPKMKGHVASGQYGTAECGLILKSHKETGPEEIVDDKKVRPTRTIVDESCHEKLVFDKAGHERVQRLAGAIEPGKKSGAQQAAAKQEAADAKVKQAGEERKGTSPRHKAAGTKGKLPAKHSQAV